MLQSWVERRNADEYIKPRKDTRNLEPFMEWSLWCAIYDSVFVASSYHVSILVLVDRFSASVTTERSLPQRGGVEGGGGVSVYQCKYKLLVNISRPYMSSADHSTKEKVVWNWVCVKRCHRKIAAFIIIHGRVKWMLTTSALTTTATTTTPTAILLVCIVILACTRECRSISMNYISQVRRQVTSTRRVGHPPHPTWGKINPMNLVTAGLFYINEYILIQRKLFLPHGVIVNVPSQENVSSKSWTYGSNNTV